MGNPLTGTGTKLGEVGVIGESQEAEGVRGVGHKGAGVSGTSENWHGVAGQSQSTTGGAGVYGKGLPAGFFEGNIYVTGKIDCPKGTLHCFDVSISNADCAEDFDLSGVETIEPGTVMTLDQEGKLKQSENAYDRRVAGVISGAGNYKPGIVLDKQASHTHRVPIALLGKVFCKVDAKYSPIEVGDLLTTSPTVGHAMKAEDPLKVFGSVIGKALLPLRAGQGMIPILVSLQ
jgi:hypothetical protein